MEKVNYEKKGDLTKVFYSLGRYIFIRVSFKMRT